MSATERLGLFHFWRAVGERMGIHDIPPDYGMFEDFNRRYEAANFRYADSNRRVADAVLRMFCHWFPPPLRPLVRVSILALLDESVLESFGYAQPGTVLRRAVGAALRLRAWWVGVLPKRRKPRLRTRLRHRSHPDGYRIEELGPPGS